MALLKERKFKKSEGFTLGAYSQRGFAPLRPRYLNFILKGSLRGRAPQSWLRDFLNREYFIGN
ncbi:MAG: hypothetical protein D6710_00850 [Nitrospirae bacterium]|nr:MAG: hypothetical protein D6710_00850 [Nitrospirota bacterium]